MNALAEEMTNNARQFRTWAQGGEVTLPPSTLLIYAEAMHDAARELMLMQWHVQGGPPQRNPHAAPGWRPVVIEGGRAA